MSLEKAIIIYATAIVVLLVLIALTLFRSLAKRRRNAKAASAAEPAKERQPARAPIDWQGALHKLRPDKLLTGEMWVKVLGAAFVALCLGVVVVVFVFPLGAAWAAGGSFVAVAAMVGMFFVLLD